MTEMSCTRSSLSHGREHGRLRTCIGKPPLGEIVMACTSCRGSRQLGDTLKVNLWKILAKAITASSTAGNGAFMPSIFASLLKFAVENLPQFEIPGACFGLSQPYHLCAWLLIKEDGVYTDMWSTQHMMEICQMACCYHTLVPDVFAQCYDKKTMYDNYW